MTKLSDGGGQRCGPRSKLGLYPRLLHALESAIPALAVHQAAQLIDPVSNELIWMKSLSKPPLACTGQKRVFAMKNSAHELRAEQPGYPRHP